MDDSLLDRLERQQPGASSDRTVGIAVGTGDEELVLT